MDTQDRQLIQEYSQGNQESFEILVRRHGRLVWGICNSMLWRTEDAEDAFQSVFLVLSTKASRLQSHGSIAGWLHETTLRTCLNLRRKLARSREVAIIEEPVSEQCDPWRTIAKASEEELLYNEINDLPKRFREVILLCHVEGKSRSEAAMLLDRSVLSVKSLLARGRQLLRQRLVKRGIVATSALGIFLLEKSVQASESVPVEAGSLPVVSETLYQSTLAKCDSGLTNPATFQLGPVVQSLAGKRTNNFSFMLNHCVSVGLVAATVLVIFTSTLVLRSNVVEDPFLVSMHELEMLQRHGESPTVAVVIPQEQEPGSQANLSQSKQQPSALEREQSVDINNGEMEIVDAGVPAKWVIRTRGNGIVSSTADEPSRGKLACLIQSDEAGDFNGILQGMAASDLIGKKIRLRASMRSTCDQEINMTNAHMWMRIDRIGESVQPGGSAYFDNMGARPVRGSQWKDYDIVGVVPEKAQAITFGFFLKGRGKFWIDDVRLDIVDDSTSTTGRTTEPRKQTAKMREEQAKAMMAMMARMKKRTKVTAAKQRPGTYRIQGATQVRSAGNVKEETVLLFPLPLSYRDQVPLDYKFTVEPESAISSISIERDQMDNYVANLVLKPVRQVDVKFESTVLVGPSDFNLPADEIKVPEQWPEETLPWLQSTWCADASNERIAKIGKQITGETDDVMEIIAAVEQEAKAIFRTASGRVKELTASEALDKRGSCTSCANLVAALMRACNVPTRILAGYPSWSGPLQTHYIVESYVPGYGWYPIESTRLESPWPNSHQVNVAIIPIEYESEELARRRKSAAGGVPFLSLTEWDSNLIFTKGNIEDAPFCDHECQLIDQMELQPEEWSKKIKTAKSKWAAWLETQAKPQAKNLSFQ